MVNTKVPLGCIDSSGEKTDEPFSLNLEPREEFSIPVEEKEDDIEIAHVVWVELQHLNTTELFQKIENTFKEIIQAEQEFKEAISGKVKESFLTGKITAIEELYQSVLCNIRFFERVRDLVNEREGKSVE
jgi:hypothetical protein